MSPDSLDSRVARLEQRADNQGQDITALAPFLRDQAVLADRYQRLQRDVDRLADSQRETDDRIEQYVKEIADRDRQAQDKEQAREDKERKDRFVRAVTLLTLLATFVSTTAAVIALVLH